MQQIRNARLRAALPYLSSIALTLWLVPDGVNPFSHSAFAPHSDTGGGVWSCRRRSEFRSVGLSECGNLTSSRSISPTHISVHCLMRHCPGGQGHFWAAAHPPWPAGGLLIANTVEP